MADRLKVPGLPLFLIATVFGVSSTAQAYLLRTLEGGESHSLLALLALNLVYWYVPALLAPTIMAVAVRYQLGRVRWPLQVALHVAGAAVYSFAHITILLAARWLLAWIGGLPYPMGQPTLESFWVYARVTYLSQLDWLLMTYLFLVGLAHALAYRRESEARSLDAAHLETRLVEAQLQALQRQLHPHFLFNTLNTISGLMRTNIDAADQMIDHLGDLLRMTLHSSGTQEVALKRELDVLQKYLEIEQARFGDRLRVTLRIDPDTLDAQVPNLLLQPLVENAVRHGIAPHVRPGRIAIHSARDGGQLTIDIVDSGAGLPPDRLMALNRGVGLDNTRARLQHLYPSAYRFAFSNLDDGFCVTVTIPFRVVDAPGVMVPREGAA
jgi:two-component system, LytTR family, sensor kinase